MADQPVSLNDYCSRLARRLGMFGGIALSIVALSTVAIFAFSYYRLVIEKAFSGYIPSFSFWTQANDRHEAQRTLAGIVDSQGLDAAIVIDGSGALIAHKGSDSILEWLLSSHQMQISGNGLLLRHEFELRDSASAPHVIGKIVIAQVVPYFYMLIVCNCSRPYASVGGRPARAA